ncbi:MAG: hypothetical protein IPH13_08290 [Planctomycetes bacterium]|nr:hypothetical protein [Planctomycetota bacterium]MCC7169715.1 hypothetical protein [Planctomycetota bacterium]
MRRRFVRALLSLVLIGLPSCVSSVIEEWRADEVRVMGVPEVGDRQVSFAIGVKNVRRIEDGVYAFTIPLRDAIEDSPRLEWLGPRLAQGSRIYTELWDPTPYGISWNAFGWPSNAAQRAFLSATPPTAGTERVVVSKPYFVGLSRRGYLGLRVERAEGGDLVAQIFRSRDPDFEEWRFVGSVAIGRSRQSPWRARIAPWLMPVAALTDLALLPLYLAHNLIAHGEFVGPGAAGP